MKAIISNDIKVTATSEILKYCNENLVLNNPEYIKKERMGFWIGNTPKKLYIYQINQNNITIPFGELNNIWHIIKNYEISTDFCSNKIHINGNIDLYDYQKKAIEEAKNKKGGILISSAGSGKTQMGIALIKELGLKTLWITHTVDLLKQSRDRFKQYFDCSIGIITDGKVEIGDVTFATVQTLHRLNLKEYENEFSLIIVDECHRVSSSPAKLTMFGKVINSLKARYKYGLTATAHRSDGMIRTMFAYIGDICYEVPATATESKTMKANINQIETDFKLEYNSECIESDGTLNYIKFISELCLDEKRNKQIANDIIKNKDCSLLVLSSRLEQLRQIKELVGYGVMIDGSMTSKKGKKQREEAIKDMQDGKEKVLFASYNLAKEGLDIPCLERLFLASPQKDKAIIIQSVGRIERKCEKKDPCVYDYVDNVGMCINMWKNRKSVYGKNNNKIILGGE